MYKRKSQAGGFYTVGDNNTSSLRMCGNKLVRFVFCSIISFSSASKNSFDFMLLVSYSDI